MFDYNLNIVILSKNINILSIDRIHQKLFGNHVGDSS